MASKQIQEMEKIVRMGHHLAEAIKIIESILNTSKDSEVRAALAPMLAQLKSATEKFKKEEVVEVQQDDLTKIVGLIKEDLKQLRKLWKASLDAIKAEEKETKKEQADIKKISDMIGQLKTALQMIAENKFLDQKRLEDGIDSLNGELKKQILEEKEIKKIVSKFEVVVKTINNATQLLFQKEAILKKSDPKVKDYFTALETDYQKNFAKITDLDKVIVMHISQDKKLNEIMVKIAGLRKNSQLILEKKPEYGELLNEADNLEKMEKWYQQDGKKVLEAYEDIKKLIKSELEIYLKEDKALDQILKSVK
jgi:hypothetical protein